MKRKKIFNEVAFDYSDEFKAELDRRMEDYRSGKAKMITAEESKRRIDEIQMQVKTTAS